jgi:N-acetylmuramoyl-L-alanine amidase
MRKTNMAIVLALVSVMVVSGSVTAKGRPGGGSGGSLLRSVCIDPGHGGNDPGASNSAISEKDLNLQVGLLLESLLLQNGYQVHMTRRDDRSLTNNDRYSFCNATNATTLISIHHNGASDPDIDYSLALYQQNNSLTLARIVGQSVTAEFGMSSSFRTEKFPSGVLIKSSMPSMMSEGYFLTNLQRQNQLTADLNGTIQQEAGALYAGVVAYYLSR